MRKTILLVIGVLLLAGAVYSAMAFRKVYAKQDLSMTTSLQAGFSIDTITNVAVAGGVEGFRGGVIKMKIGAGTSTKRGVGNVDTAIIVLRSYLPDGSFRKIDSGMFNAIPCSLVTSKTVATAGNDTLFWGDLRCWIMVGDSCGDTVQTYTYPFTAVGFMRE